MHFGLLDTLVFALYIIGTVVFAMWMGSRSKGGQSADGFFRADKQLPWYVVGASIISAGVSSEQFIGTVGIAYLYGMSVANYQWGAPIVYTILIFIFLPFYMRGNVTTMPEFLERRFNSTCRVIYAMVSLIGMAVLLGITLFAGAKAMSVLFPGLTITYGILILAGAAAAYSIYGGLLSSVWADFVQYIVLMVGGTVVGLYSLYYSGGLGNLLDAMPEKAIMLYSSQHEVLPWFGVLALFFSVSIWYNCANQVIVQRFLGARSEWDARMGVVMAGLSMAIFPLLVVVPGIAAFYLFHDELSDGDQSWAFLVKHMLPSGLVGLVLAGLASSILGTLAAVVNSSSTIFTYDFYKALIRKDSTDKELFLTGRISAAAAMIIGIAAALIYARSGGSIFVQIQTAFSYMAAPIAAIFLVGILWRGATPAAATFSLIAGFVALPIFVYIIFPKTMLNPYDSFPHHTFAVFLFTIISIIVTSFFTKPKSAEQLRGVIWNRSALSVPAEEKHLNRGLRDFRLWWFIMVAVIATLYGITYSRANHTSWLEAEKQDYRALAGGSIRIQARSEMKNFNLWTGQNSRQVLFTPSTGGDAIQFDVPAKKAGQYTVAAVVTRGPGYGTFGVAINGTTETMTVHRTTAGDKALSYIVTENPLATFDGNTSGKAGLFGGEPNRYVLDRLEIGPVELRDGTNQLTFVAGSAPGYIGIDQIILTPVKKK